MKKIHMSLICILPFVLVFLFLSAFKLVSIYGDINITEIEISDNSQIIYENNATIAMNYDEFIFLNVKLYPLYNSEKNVAFVSSDNEVCTAAYVSGVLTLRAKGTGECTITTVQADENCTITLHIIVQA